MGFPLSLYEDKGMSTKRQRQILRNRRLEFEREVAENLKKAQKKKKSKKKTTPNSKKKKKKSIKEYFL